MPFSLLKLDADTRSVVSKVKGWPVEGSVWAFDKKGAHTFYATNVWSLVLDACLLLRQFISLLPPNSIIFIGAGSPCQDLTSIGRGKGTLGLAGDRSVHIHCVWAVLYFLSKTRFWERTVILLENAGSMLPHMKKYIHDLFGIPHACCHYLNCSTWGSVTRARYFFTSSDLTVLPDHSPSPFDPGWFPTVKPSKENPARFVPIPLPPWLRPRDYTSKGDVVQSPLAYHPKNLLYDISFFGSWELFCDACHANRSNLYPDIPFKQFLPEFLWKEWDSLIEWKADFDSQLTPEILATVSKLQEFYSNPHIYLPFRLPSLEEKAKDSELSSLIITTQQEANPPLRTLHNIIGNFFKPSAVLAALGGADRLSNFVNGANTPNQWQPSSPSQVDTAFSNLKQTVSQSITSQPTLHSHLVEKWYPKNLPKLESLDFWHKAFHLQTPPVLTSPMTPLPTPPPTAPKQFISPLSPLALGQLQKFDALYQLTTKAIFHNYHLDVLLSAPFPPFKSLALPILLSTSHLKKFNFLKSYFQGWELTQSSVVILVLYEDANHVEFFSFGPISSYQQLYLLSFSLPLILSNFHFFSNKSHHLLLFNPSLLNFMLFGTSPRIFPLTSISFSNSLLLPCSIIFRTLVLLPSSIHHLGTLLSLPHFFRILFLNGLPPFLKAPKTPPCGALNVVLILLVTFLSLDMFNFGSIFTTNTKKPMNSLLSPSFFYRGTLLELFLQLRTFSFVRSIILPLPNQ